VQAASNVAAVVCVGALAYVGERTRARTERRLRAALAQCAESRDDLRTASETKQKFLANMSHGTHMHRPSPLRRSRLISVSLRRRVSQPHDWSSGLFRRSIVVGPNFILFIWLRCSCTAGDWIFISGDIVT
jgi:hypothetical protein